MFEWVLNLPLTLALTFLVPIQDEERKLTYIFIFAILCGASKGLMKALKAFIKPSEPPQRSAKIKIQVNFCFHRIFWNARGGKGQTCLFPWIALPIASPLTYSRFLTLFVLSLSFLLDLPLTLSLASLLVFTCFRHSFVIQF